ncbi:ABC transporter ATP-binding protein [Bacillus songklensis]|uniref:ABC transporter ATP-binding protein n=1 Tax=Bacillus songklensis TaxID=1069116 RepID=A0ABV8B8A2_9BACI
MEYVIDLQQVSWKRGEAALLDNVNWQVKKGEHWVLLGLNGSGKTTLLNLINGYIWPTTGTVQVLGKRFGSTNLPELRKSIGWVSSSLQEKLYGNDLAQEVIISGKHASIGLYEHVTEEDLNRALSLLNILGCSHLVNRTYETCSQGEKQKLLIARALMADPDILILDEPCNGLDLFARERLLQSVNELAVMENGPTLIYVTHHIEEILPVFQHALLLRSGEVFMKGNTKEVLGKENLSAFFEHPVSVKWDDDRASVQLI